MSYCKKLTIDLGEEGGILYVTDDSGKAKELRESGEAVLVHLHEGNRNQDFSDFLFAVEDPDWSDTDYQERVFRRLKNLPWRILETERCLIRETTVADVDAFYEIYANPAITRYMEGLYPDPEQERQYVKEYIEKIYTYYEYGVWTVVEKESGSVIGRAGLSARAGYREPELGFLIGADWQQRGYAEEVCRGILEFAGSRLGFERVQVLVQTGNEPSLRLCRKLGFCGEERVELNGTEHYRLLLDLTCPVGE